MTVYFLNSENKSLFATLSVYYNIRVKEKVFKIGRSKDKKKIVISLTVKDNLLKNLRCRWFVKMSYSDVPIVKYGIGNEKTKSAFKRQM